MSPTVSRLLVESERLFVAGYGHRYTAGLLVGRSRKIISRAMQNLISNQLDLVLGYKVYPWSIQVTASVEYLGCCKLAKSLTN
jgi:hypothetical protein